MRYWRGPDWRECWWVPGSWPGCRGGRRPTGWTVGGIQRLHSCGLLLGSFRPDEQVCMLRTLVRDKAILVAETGDWLRRMQKNLDQMNVRVHRAVSDIDGVTGMAIVRAIVGGERDAQQLAQLRDRRRHQSEEAIAEQLSGHWRADHLFTLGQALKMYDAIQERIAEYEREIRSAAGKRRRNWTTRKRRRRSKSAGKKSGPKRGELCSPLRRYQKYNTSGRTCPLASRQGPHSIW